MAAAWDDMNEPDLKVVGFIENPVVLEREAGEIGRVVMICLADAGEARDQCANRHEIGDKFVACIFPKLFAGQNRGRAKGKVTALWLYATLTQCA
jgi:hypothetical protein